MQGRNLDGGEVRLIHVKGCIIVILVALTACSTPEGPTFPVQGIALAGPVCPVETEPPQPGCEPRPVAAAELIVRDENGDRILSVRTAADGTFGFSLPAGRYELEPQPVEGLMGTAEPITFEVVAGPVELAPLGYDTGIR